MGQPNLLLILSDEQRWDTLGCYGQGMPVTPHLDALAARGTRFARAYTSTPLCGPARASLQTGLYPSATGCIANNMPLPIGMPTLADRLHAGGYETAYVGKWHLASSSHEGEGCYWTRPIPAARRGGWRDFWVAADVPEYTSRGMAGWLFDADGERVEWEGRYRADAYTDLALGYLAGRREGGAGEGGAGGAGGAGDGERGEGRDEGRRPFALMLSLVEPHAQPYHAMYQGPPGPRTRHEYRQITYEGPDALVPRFADAPLPPDLEALPGQAREFWPDYLAACAAVDANVGRLLAAVDLANTVVIYASDHGCHFFSHLPGVAKCTHHESSIRIPLLAAGPGFDAGRVVDTAVSLIDVPPTLLTAAGLPTAPMVGVPLQTPRTTDVLVELPPAALPHTRVVIPSAAPA